MALLHAPFGQSFSEDRMPEKSRKPSPWWTKRPTGEPESSIPHRDLSQDPTARAEAETSWKQHYERTMGKPKSSTPIR